MNFNIDLKECILKKKYEIEKEKIEEGKLLIDSCKNNKNSKIISLDERGKIISTTDFYNLITTYENNGIENVNFIIGGSNGLSEFVREKSDYILSFGKMVFPHLMIRIMLIEQLYRIWTLKNNHPYHK